MDIIIAYAGSIGLRIFLDRHSSKNDNYVSEPLWYIPGDPYYTEAQWIADWVMLATRYANTPTVIGGDLWNEPKETSTWGTSSPATDWNGAATRCGNAILAANPHWLIIVEGVQYFAGVENGWGSNLAGVASLPIVLSSPAFTRQIVYSFHEYPASVVNRPIFSDPTYPANMPPHWTTYWGYIFRQNIAPLLMGEFGTKLLTTVSILCCAAVQHTRTVLASS